MPLDVLFMNVSSGTGNWSETRLRGAGEGAKGVAMSQTHAIAGGRTRRRIWAIRIAAAVLFITPAFVLPGWWCGRGADALYEGRLDAVRPLANEVARWVSSGVTTSDFNTGSSRFNGEWQFGTYQMAALGLLQVIEAHPEERDRYLPTVEKCIEKLIDPEVRRFDTEAWGADALETLDSNEGHGAYLGYLNLVLSAYRKIAGKATYNDLNDRISAALARRFDEDPYTIIETYPEEAYPVDNCAAIASVALRDKAAGAEVSKCVNAFLEILGEQYTERRSGLLFQAVDHSTGEHCERPRASGTALAAYFLSFADREVSYQLFDALRTSCSARMGGFAAIKEYPPGVEPGRGDIDSGPVVLGLSFSGTGFTLATARIHRDRELYQGIYRLAHLVGGPIRFGERRTFVCGGPLGNAIMLAMLTAGGAA